MKHIYYAFLHCLGFSQNELFLISEKYSDSKIFYETLSYENIFGITKNSSRAENILKNIHHFQEQKIENILNHLGVSLIIFHDPSYPENLKHISHSPFLLYVRGKLPQDKMIAIIGSRKISPYGKKIIDRIVPEVGKIFPIVSGGAAGCDIHAHIACMKNSIPTVCVIGTGIDQNYPVSHKSHYDEIVKSGGAILSIFRIGEPGNPYNFPVRNEIVAGLSQGVIVVEAGEKSGSLITVQLALDFGKDVFAFPGDIFHSQSFGTNRLIQSGAVQCVCSGDDILQNYNILVRSKVHSEKIPHLSGIQEKIYHFLLTGNHFYEDIIQALGVTSFELSQNLSFLEIQGIIKKDITGVYQIC